MSRVNEIGDKKMKSYIGTAELIWHENDEYEVLTDPSGWKLVFIMNHYKNESTNCILYLLT